jgi:hypothetical protein
LARFIATVALCSSASVSGPSSGKSAIPRLAVTSRSWPPMLNGLRSARPQLVGDHRDVLVALDAGQQDREHVARRARDRVALAQRALERERHRAQQVVAVAAAEPLVDALEAVEPELDDGELVLVRCAWTIATVRRSPKRRALASPVSVSWSASAWISRSSRALFARSVASASWTSRSPSRSSRTSSSSWISREAGPSRPPRAPARAPRPRDGDASRRGGRCSAA